MLQTNDICLWVVFFSRQILNQSVTQILQQHCKLNQWREFKRHQRRKQMSLICNDAYLEQSTHHKISSYEVWACAVFLFWLISIPFSIDFFAQMGNKLNHNKILWVTKEFTELVSLLYLIFSACLQATNKKPYTSDFTTHFVEMIEPSQGNE